MYILIYAILGCSTSIVYNLAKKLIEIKYPDDVSTPKGRSLKIVKTTVCVAISGFYVLMVIVNAGNIGGVVLWLLPTLGILLFMLVAYIAVGGNTGK